MRTPEPAPHEAWCAGWHTDAITCARTTALRRQSAADPWQCPYSRHGYHRFSKHNPTGDDRCEFDGCARTWAELQDAAS